MTATLPTGTVTLVFTDIEGSTTLLKQLGDRYADVVADHRLVLRQAFGERSGAELDTQGDSFFFAFASARDAVAAAVAAQRRLAAHPWPDDAAVRVRMSVHTGEPRLGEEGYVGIDVVRAARICAIGHGGQVLLSSATAALVSQYPEGVRPRALGQVRLKDIDEPERVHQLDIDGLPTSFPPLRAEDEEPLDRGARLERQLGPHIERTVQEALASLEAPGREPPVNAAEVAAKGLGVAVVATIAAALIVVVLVVALVLLVRLVF